MNNLMTILQMIILNDLMNIMITPVTDTSTKWEDCDDDTMLLISDADNFNIPISKGAFELLLEACDQTELWISSMITGDEVDDNGLQAAAIPTVTGALEDEDNILDNQLSKPLTDRQTEQYIDDHEANEVNERERFMD